MSQLSAELPQLTERFEVRSRLGEGAFGVVYEAYDRQMQRTVAAKRLLQAVGQSLYRFKNEFRALADITHPNLVRLYELMSDGTHWFFTMELVEGNDFYFHVRHHQLEVGQLPLEERSAPTMDHAARAVVRDTHGAADPTLDGRSSQARTRVSIDPRSRPTTEISNMSFEKLDLGRLRGVLAQLVEGVSALHAAGVLHRDIKPSNVIVTPEGQVKLLDFGMATALEGSELSMTIAGTPAFMSPEQSRGDTLTEASDWYAVGVMLYQALLGRLPFEGDYKAVMDRKQSTEISWPPQARHHLPGDLIELTTGLLSIDPKRRPDAEAIRKLVGDSAWVSPTDSQQHLVRPSTELVGREKHLNKMLKTFEECQQTKATLLLVRGRSGMGKTALVNHFLSLLPLLSRRSICLTGRCYDRETLPFKAVDSLIDGLSRFLNKQPFDVAQSLLPRHISALARLFPVMQGVEAVLRFIQRAPEIPDRHQLRQLAFGALRELLRRLAIQRPMALFIDDLQWGDLDSAELLGELFRPPDPPRILLILAYRTEELESNPLLTELLRRRIPPSDHVDVIDIPVGELSIEASAKLAQEMIQDERAADPVFLRQVVEESAGSPFLITELIRHLQQGSDSSAGLSLEAALSARYDALPDPARGLLEVVAVAGQPVGTHIAVKAADLGSDEHDAKSTLLRENLVKTWQTRNLEAIETYHQRIRDVVSDRLSLETRLAIHRRLARALEASGVDDPAALAHHLFEAGEVEKSVQYTVEAANEAAFALAFERAAELYRLAMERYPGPHPEQHQLKVKLGDALINSGRGSEAADILLETLDTAEGDERMALGRRAAEQLMRSGHLDRAAVVFNRLLDSVQMAPLRQPFKTLLALLWGRFRLKLRGIEFSERVESEIPPRELQRIDLCLAISLGMTTIDSIQGALFQTNYLRLALESGEPKRITLGLLMEAGHQFYQGGNMLRAEEVLARATVMADRLKFHYARALAALMSGARAMFHCRLTRALEQFDKADEIYTRHCVGVTFERTTLDVLRYGTMLHLGQIKKVAHKVPRTINEAKLRGDLYGQTFQNPPWIFILLARDDPERAASEVERTMGRWSTRGLNLQRYGELLSLVQIDLYNGEGHKALERLLAQWSSLQRSQLMRLQFLRIDVTMYLARCALMSARAGHNRKRALRIAHRAARRLRNENNNWGTTLYWLLDAGIAAVEGRTERAIELFQAAENFARETEMGLYVTAARRFRGRLMQQAGAGLVKKAGRWMAKQGIKNPDKMMRLVMPGTPIWWADELDDANDPSRITLSHSIE